MRSVTELEQSQDGNAVRVIANEKEFLTLIAAVDKTLDERGVQIPWRPIFALFEVGREVDEELELPTPGS